MIFHDKKYNIYSGYLCGVNIYLLMPWLQLLPGHQQVEYQPISGTALLEINAAAFNFEVCTFDPNLSQIVMVSCKK